MTTLEAFMAYITFCSIAFLKQQKMIGWFEHSSFGIVYKVLKNMILKKKIHYSLNESE